MNTVVLESISNIPLSNVVVSNDALPKLPIAKNLPSELTLTLVPKLPTSLFGCIIFACIL